MGVNPMDQVEIGKKIAKLRRRDGLTQAALGEKIGVTNKTVSRWENGNYMPDIEMLQLLAQVFHVRIDELLSDDVCHQKADDRINTMTGESAFSMEEKTAYLKKKWRKEHLSLLVILVLILAASVILPFVFDRAYFVGFAPLIAGLEYGYQHNKMMIYVENKLFD